MKRLIILLYLLMLLVAAGCLGGGGQASNDGSGSEIVGVVDSGQTTAFLQLRGKRIPVEDASIYLFPNDYRADGSETPKTYSESDGSFSIQNVSSGKWLLEAETPEYSLVAFCNISSDDTLTDVGTMLIKEKSSLQLTIDTDIPGDIEINYTLYVLGTRIYGTGDEESLTLTIDGIPTGEEHELLLEVREPFPFPVTFSKKVTFPAGGSLPVTFSVPKP